MFLFEINVFSYIKINYRFETEKLYVIVIRLIKLYIYKYLKTSKTVF